MILKEIECSAIEAEIAHAIRKIFENRKLPCDWDGCMNLAETALNTFLEDNEIEVV